MFFKLESLRGVAACMVILYHSPFTFNGQSIAFIENSYLFVDFFFILSGFVISYAYTDKIQSGLSFSRYIIRRLGRIYPLHLFILLLWVPYILVKYYLHARGIGGELFLSSNISSFASNVFLIHAWGIHSELSWNYPSWSVSTELLAYISFYFLTAVFDKKNNLYTPLIIAICSYTILILNGYRLLNITDEMAFLTCLGGFYLGIFLFRIYIKFDIPKRFKTSNLSFLAMTIIEFTTVTLLILSISLVERHILFIALALLSFMLTIVVFSAKKNGLVGRLLSTQYIQKIGLWSYSIYMLHALILSLASNIAEYIIGLDLQQAFGVNSITINVGLLLTVILLSKYSYTWIEKKFRDLSRKHS